MKVIISGGGTGGHVFPAIAIADAIKRKSPETEILFVGAEGRMEMEKVPQAGYKIIGLWISGFQRSLTFKNLLFPVKLLHSAIKARKIIRNFKPDVAIGVGGYASGPTLNAAGAKGIPIILQEQNSYAGVTNRILGRKANRICVAYQGMEQFFPKEKIVLTGNPIRSNFEIEGKRAEGMAYYGLDADKKTILIIGGSLGARTLNQAMEASTALIESHPEVQILWQCGKFYIESYRNGKAALLPQVRIYAFLDKMDLAYAVADVVISRAGALSVSELCLVGKASILVPSPNVAEDHQTKNALALVKENAAILVRDAEAMSGMLQKAYEILADPALKLQLETQIRTLAKPNAADEIADIVLNC